MSNNHQKNNEHDVAISYYVEEIENQENQEKEEINIENFTVKELLLICDYYGFAKELKNNKYNKEQIITILVSFESNLNNYDIVSKRQNGWFYMNELKNDKFMKKFLLW